MATPSQPSAIERMLSRPKTSPDSVVQGRTVLKVNIDLLDPNPHQPRQHFDESRIEQLADGIAAAGQAQPIVVSRGAGERWFIIAGERRTRAFRLLRERSTTDEERRRWNSIEAVEQADTSEDATAILSLQENMQRQDLTALEEGEALLKVQSMAGLSIEELARRTGLEVRRVKRLLRLTKAPGFLRDAVTKGLMVETESGEEGEKSRREHRRLDMMAALEFLSLFEHHQRQSPKRAAERTEALVRKALGEGWPFRKIRDACKTAMDGQKDRATTASIGSTGVEKGTRRAFEVSGPQVTFRTDQLAALSPEQRVQLREVLEAVLEELRNGASP